MVFISIIQQIHSIFEMRFNFEKKFLNLHLINPQIPVYHPMNHHQRKKISYYRQICIHSLKHSETIAKIPAFKKAIEELNDLITQIDEVSMHQAIVITGITVDKNNIKKELIQQVMMISGAVYVKALDNKDFGVMAAVDFKSSEIVHFSQIKLISVARITLEEARKVPADDLAMSGITQEHLSEFEALIEKFNEKFIAPRLAAIDHSAITKQLEELIKQATDIKMNCLDELLPMFQLKDVDFYHLYKRI